MRNADKEITLFNFYPSQEDPNIFLSKRTNISGASVFAQTKVVVYKDGLHAANVYTIRIPESTVPNYLPPANFKELSDMSDAFTLAPKDKIVLCYADDENTTEAALEDKYGRDYVVTITGVTDNRGKLEPHWKVIGE